MPILGGDTEAQIKISTKYNPKGVKRAGKDFKQMDREFKSIGKSLVATGKKVALAFAVPIVAGLGAGIKSAVEFESQMANISTLISGDATEAVGELESGIKDLLKTVPKSADDLGAAAYDIVSAGISDTSQALKVLESSGKLAVAGLSTTGEATDILTSAINAFGLDAEESDKAADILFKTVKNGKTTVSKMAQAFGATAPVIASAKVSLEEFSAATAALTTTGLPAAQAQNSLRAAVVAIQKPTKEMSDLLEELGFESGQAALEKQGLVKTMIGLNKAADGEAEMLGKAFGSVEALTAATSLAGPQNKIYASTLKDMAEGGDAVNEAFGKQNETTAAQFQLMKNNLNVVLMEFANEIMPAVQRGIQFAIEKLEVLKVWWEEHGDTVKNIVGPAIAGLAAGFIVLKTAMAISKISAAFSLGMGLVRTQAALTAGPAGIGKLSGALLKLPIAAGIAFAGVAAAAVIAFVAVKKAIKGYTDALDDLDRSSENLAETRNKALEKVKELRAAGREEDADSLMRTITRNAPEGFAKGGAVAANTPIMVGEEGAELFVPRSNGEIIPNDRITGSERPINVTQHNVFTRSTDIEATLQALSFDLKLEMGT